MTMDMAMGLVRQVLPFVGAVAVTLGLVKVDQANELVNQGLAIAGSISTIVGLVWSMKANTKASILQSASNMPEVTQVKVTDPKLAEQGGDKVTTARG
jgi:hypothetical protein